MLNYIYNNKTYNNKVQLMQLKSGLYYYKMNGGVTNIEK